MDLETINPYTMKILIAARPVDSIRAIAGRIGASYGWTYKWARSLVRTGVFSEHKNRIVLNDQHSFYQETMNYIRHAFGQDVGFHYAALAWFGIHYQFTMTDAVFVWTRGGYNIGRSKEYYPIFIKVLAADKDWFEYYCKKLGMRAGAGVFYQTEYVDAITPAFCGNIPVDSLQDTIKFMQRHVYNFQPALEMVRATYHQGPRMKYREVAYVLKN